jgi:hypothetical protein
MRERKIIFLKIDTHIYLVAKRVYSFIGITWQICASSNSAHSQNQKIMAFSQALQSYNLKKTHTRTV